MTIRVQLQKRPRIAVRSTLGLRGYAGWVPQFAMIEDGDRRVLQVVDYVNGEGSKPAYIGWFVGPGGLTNQLAEATDIRGNMAWSPVLALVEDGLRVVQKVVDWVGGTGPKPPVGFIADTGFSDDIGSGIDLRGYQGWAPVFGIVADNERRIYQLTDWAGGAGAKPSVLSETGETLFLGEAGFTTDLAQAVDLRGPPGVGQTASDTSFVPYSSLVSTNVQDALEELADEKSNVGHTHAVGEITGLGSLATKSSVDTSEVAHNAITNAKLADMPAYTLKGNDTGASSDPKDLPVAQAKALLGIGISMAKAPPEIAYVNATTITVKAGKCRDEDDTTDLINPANFNITLAGAPVSAHRHVLFGYDASGNPAATFSTSITLPAGWQAYRRIGSIRTDASGQIRSFIQLGDRFDFLAPVKDVSDSAQSTTGTLRTLSVPLDVQVEAILNVRAVKVSSQVAVHVYPSSLPDPTLTLAGAAAGTGGVDPSVSGFAGSSTANSAGATQLRVPTNTLGQVKSISSVATTILEITTMGWTDRRGRDK